MNRTPAGCRAAASRYARDTIRYKHQRPRYRYRSSVTRNRKRIDSLASRLNAVRRVPTTFHFYRQFAGRRHQSCAPTAVLFRVTVSTESNNEFLSPIPYPTDVLGDYSSRKHGKCIPGGNAALETTRNVYEIPDEKPIRRPRVPHIYCLRTILCR